MSARVLVIGFDACEASLVRRWAAEGKLPNFAALAGASRTFQLDNPMETLPGAIWPEINTGCSSGKMGHFYIPNQLHTGEAVLRGAKPSDIDPEFYYWTQASRAGKRVAVIDPVQAVAASGIDGIQLIEWGLHDRTFEISSEPPQLLEDIRAAYGDHRVRSCDLHGQTPEGYRRLLEDLLHGVRSKAQFSSEILAREAWDLFSVTYSECHCAGHQFWHFIDPRHPWHDPNAPREFQDALLDIYAAIDGALPALLASAGPGASVFAIFSHGIDLYYDGPQLLPEVLVRLGLAGGSLGIAGRWLRRLRTRVTYLPRPVKAVVKRLARTRAMAAPAAAAGCAVDPFASPKTRAAFVNNNRCGGIRLNLRGREPFGSVEPGPEAAALLQMLRRELLGAARSCVGRTDRCPRADPGRTVRPRPPPGPARSDLRVPYRPRHARALRIAGGRPYPCPGVPSACAAQRRSHGQFAALGQRTGRCRHARDRARQCVGHRPDDTRCARRYPAGMARRPATACAWRWACAGACRRAVRAVLRRLARSSGIAGAALGQRALGADAQVAGSQRLGARIVRGALVVDAQAKRA